MIDAEVLRYPLFADDFGSPGDRVMRDAIVTARKRYECVECLDVILPGDRHRVHVGKYDGDVRQYRYCTQCCEAMGRVFNGEPDAMEKRWAWRQKILALRNTRVEYLDVTRLADDHRRYVVLRR